MFQQLRTSSLFGRLLYEFGQYSSDFFQTLSLLFPISLKVNFFFMNLTVSWQSLKKMIWWKQGSITSRRSTSKFNVKVESQKIKKIKLLKKGEATLSNNGRYCLTREKRLVATAESPVSEWASAIAHSALGEFAPYSPNLPPTIP